MGETTHCTVDNLLLRLRSPQTVSVEEMYALGFPPDVLSAAARLGITWTALVQLHLAHNRPKCRGAPLFPILLDLAALRDRKGEER